MTNHQHTIGLAALSALVLTAHLAAQQAPSAAAPGAAPPAAEAAKRRQLVEVRRAGRRLSRGFCGPPHHLPVVSTPGPGLSA
jgi:hypothetical protein